MNMVITLISMRNNRTTSHRKITILIGIPLNPMHRQQLELLLTDDLLLQGHWGEEDATVGR